MNLLSATALSKSYGDKTLLENLSFGIEEGERIGLIGVNGTGKSTLLRLMAGVDTPDSGSIAKARTANVEYLAQDPSFSPNLTVAQALAGKAPTFAATAIATQLGITDFDALIGTLSGGQQKRVALAKLLAEPADLLLLDEPTNHVDHATVLWLENFLRRRAGALLMITHDRYFLERVVNRIFELDRGQLFRYPGNYEVFLETKMLREENESLALQKREQFLQRELEWIRRGPRARGTKQKARTERYYQTLDEQPQKASGDMEMWQVNSRLGNTVVELEGVSKAYSQPLLKDFTFRVGRADRIGIVGPSGCGKSTLLKMMAGSVLPDAGSVNIGATVKLGYYSQEQAPIDDKQRVIDYVKETANYIETPDGQTITAAQMLERFLFPGAVQWTPVGNLSGGERRRLALLRILLQAPNVLLLDEPTNDLDLSTLSVLENYLDDFKGAVITVSHDRYFVDRVCDTVLAFTGNGEIATHLGRLSDYLERQVAGQAELPKVQTSATSAKNERVATARALRFTFQEQKEYATIDADIAKVEQELAEVTQKLTTAGNDYTLTERLYSEQQALEARLESLIERWTYLQERAEEIARNQKP